MAEKRFVRLPALVRTDEDNRWTVGERIIDANSVISIGTAKPVKHIDGSTIPTVTFLEVSDEFSRSSSIFAVPDMTPGDVAVRLGIFFHG